MAITSYRASWLGLATVALLFAAAPAAEAVVVSISPHRALYRLRLDRTRPGSDVAGASGAMYYEWGETCDGWTVDQRFRLHLVFAEQGATDLNSTLLTWESKDGLRYRFNEKRVRNGDVEDDIRGEAHLDGKGKGGVAQFEKPERKTITLAPGVLFPTAHTLVLIRRAEAGDAFVARKVFDGATVENAGEITAVIGRKIQPDSHSTKGLDRQLLQRPSWRMSLAFFSAGSDRSDTDTPDYELTMRLFDNGVSSNMSLNYGDYALKATLEDIEALSKPRCRSPRG